MTSLYTGLGATFENIALVREKQYYAYGDNLFILWLWMQVAAQMVAAIIAQADHNYPTEDVLTANQWLYKDRKRTRTSQDFIIRMLFRQVQLALLYKCSALHLGFCPCVFQGVKNALLL